MVWLVILICLDYLTAYTWFQTETCMCLYCLIVVFSLGHTRIIESAFFLNFGKHLCCLVFWEMFMFLSPVYINFRLSCVNTVASVIASQTIFLLSDRSVYSHCNWWVCRSCTQYSSMRFVESQASMIYLVSFLINRQYCENPLSLCSNLRYEAQYICAFGCFAGI